MADYNIFIHSNGTGTSGGGMPSQTTPWANSPQNDQSAVFQTAQNAIQKGQEFATSGLNGVVNTGVAVLSQAAPWIALALIIGKTAEKVVQTGFTHLEIYTGHYEYSLGFDNFKTVINNALNPVGLALKNLHRQNQFDLENKKIEQQRKLVGDSILSTSVKGV